MVKLKKFSLKRVPKFVLYSLDNPYLSIHAKHIRVFNYSQYKTFLELFEKLYVPLYRDLSLESGVNIVSIALPLNSLMHYATDLYKEGAKLKNFADKIYAESKRLKPYLETTSPNHIVLTPNYIWDVKITLMDVHNYA